MCLILIFASSFFGLVELENLLFSPESILSFSDVLLFLSSESSSSNIAGEELIYQKIAGPKDDLSGPQNTPAILEDDDFDDTNSSTSEKESIVSGEKTSSFFGLVELENLLFSPESILSFSDVLLFLSSESSSSNIAGEELIYQKIAGPKDDLSGPQNTPAILEDDDFDDTNSSTSEKESIVSGEKTSSFFGLVELENLLFSPESILSFSDVLLFVSSESSSSYIAGEELIYQKIAGLKNDLYGPQNTPAILEDDDSDDTNSSTEK
ncbi:hypothetical protein QTP88_025488 [Uroleucon formosanum]